MPTPPSVNLGEVTFVRRTPKAVLYDFGGVSRWVPCSQMVRGPGEGETGPLVVSGWLAEKIAKEKRRDFVYYGEHSLASVLRPFARLGERGFGTLSNEMLCRAKEALDAYEAAVMLQGPPAEAHLVGTVVLCGKKPNAQAHRLEVVVEKGPYDDVDIESFAQKLKTALRALGVDVKEEPE